MTENPQLPFLPPQEVLQPELALVPRGDDLPAVIPPPAEISTLDEWLDEHGGPLLDYVMPLNKPGATYKYKSNEYPKTPDRFSVLDKIRGFKVEYLRSLYNHLASGQTYESFGGRLFIGDTRKQRWENEIEEWKVVRIMGELEGRSNLEQMGMKMIQGEYRYGSAPVLMAFMKRYQVQVAQVEKKIIHEHKHEGHVDHAHSNTMRLIVAEGAEPVDANIEDQNATILP